MITQVTRLNKSQNEEKEVMEELINQPFIDTKEPLVNVEEPVNEFFTDDLLVPMSQVRLKEVDIKGLKDENEKIKLELDKSIEEKNKAWNEKSQLQKKFNELKERNTGKDPLHGAKHLIWDTLFVEITKLGIT